MTLEQIKGVAEKLDPATIQTFVHTARLVVEAVADEAQASASTQMPGQTDYATATLDHSTPAGGWLNVEQIRETSRKMTEAVAAEKWVDGFICAVQFMAMIGAI